MSSLGDFIGLFSKRILYVRIWRNRLSVLDVHSGASFDDEPWVAIGGTSKAVVKIGRSARNATELVVNPFGHPRTLISDFTVAEELLRRVVRSLRTSWWQPSPIIVMHPLEMLEGGLTQVESRALTELAIGAGARTVFLHTGRELSRDELRVGFEGSDSRVESDVRFTRTR
jgi:rod shape-determining protein MreB